METTINYTLPPGDRTSTRRNLITLFLNEIPGTGNGNNASRYQYNVEQFNNYIIYLRRPTQLNKGFDFTVNIDGLYFKKSRLYSTPSHQDIIDTLTYCKHNYPTLYPSIAKSLKQIYNCVPIILTPSGATFTDYNNNHHPIEIILLAVKWLFIEQDCAYWNYSGRTMFYDVLLEKQLIL